MFFKLHIFFFQLKEDSEYTYREVIQKPISPAYKAILDKLKNCSIKHSAITINHQTANLEESTAAASDS